MKCIVHNLKNYKIAWYYNGIILGLGNLRIRDDKIISVENLLPKYLDKMNDKLTALLNDNQSLYYYK